MEEIPSEITSGYRKDQLALLDSQGRVICVFDKGIMNHFFMGDRVSGEQTSL
jgi:hypothetical protein